MRSQGPSFQRFISQDNTPYKRDKKYDNCRALWIRVYYRAACDYISYKSSKNIKELRDAKDAERWLFTDNDGLDLLCDALGLRVSMLRNWALTATKADIKKLETFEREDAIETETVMVDSDIDDF